MKERPILFNGPMVRAILDGRKTTTRRIVKNQPDHRGEPCECYTSGPCALCGDENDDSICPYGKSGDRLWVRETWDFRIFPECIRVAYGSDGSQKDFPPRADFNPMIYGYDRWRPSIHMPRWASRITLEIVSVRVERLQYISEDDAMKEGAAPVLVPPDGGSCPHVEGFRELWDSINSKRGFGWDANPWVWVVEFKRVMPEGGE